MKKKLIASLLATTSMLSLIPATSALATSTVSTTGSISFFAAENYETNGVIHTTLKTSIGDVEAWYFADNSTDYSGQLPGSKGHTTVETNRTQKTSSDGAKSYTVSSVLVAPSGQDVIFRETFSNAEGMNLKIDGNLVFSVPRSETEYSGIAVKFKMPNTNNFKLETYETGRHKSDSSTRTTYSLIPMTGIETGNKSAEEAVKVQQAFLNYTASNNTTLQELQNLANGVVDTSNFNVTITQTSKVDSTESSPGSISGNITVTNKDGSTNYSSSYKMVISASGQSIDTVYESLNNYCNNYGASNSSKASDFTSAVKITNSAFSVDVGNWSLTPATDVKEGSLSCNVYIKENGTIKRTISVNKTISKLATTTATANEIVQGIIDNYVATNSSSKDSLLNACEAAVGNNITVTIPAWNLTPSTEVKKGTLLGEINITDGLTEQTVPLNLTIDYLKQSVETVAKLYVDAAKKYVATNETTSDDLIGMVKVTNADISVKSDNFKLIPATDESTGKVSTNLIITDGINTVTQPIQIQIGYYNEELSTALAKVQKYLSNFVATNDTKTNQILIDLNTEINNSNIFVSYSNENDERVEKVNATENAAGYIKGKLLLADSEGHEVKVPVDLVIAKLSQSIDNAEQKVTAYINSLKGSNDLTDSEILFGMQNLLDSNITAKIVDFDKVLATEDSKGLLTGKVILSNGSETREIPINISINLQAQNISNVINRINSKLSSMYLLNEDTASTLELELQDCITGAEGSKITIKVRDKDFNKTLATQDSPGFVTGDITVIDNNTNIEYVLYNIPIKQLAQTLENANEKINKVLDLYKANNNSVQSELNDLIQGCITGSEGSNITAVINKFELSQSTPTNNGYLNVEVTLSDGSNNVIVTKNYEIEKITETIDEAINNLEIALPSFNVTNNTTKEDLKDMIKNVVAENIEVEVNTFDKTLATNMNEGKIKSNITLQDTLTNATKETDLNLVIKKLHQSLEEAEDSVKDKIPSLDVDNDTTADDIKDQIKDVVGDNIDVEIKDFNKKPATDKEDGKVTGSIIITDKETGEKSEIPFEVTIPKLPSSGGSGGGSSSSNSKDKNDSIKIEEKKNETTYSNESVKGQWKNENGKWYFYNSNGNVVTGWVFINGYWYYFDVSGIMQIGWFKDIDEQWYYLNPRAGALLGVRMSGWLQDIDGNWYQLDMKTGIMQTGWYQDTNGKWYYLNTSSNGYKGAMKSGWIYDNGNWYYLNTKSNGYKGAMQTGWYQDTNGKWYYSYSNGAMAHDTYINGYYLGSDGSWIK